MGKEWLVHVDVFIVRMTMKHQEKARLVVEVILLNSSLVLGSRYSLFIAYSLQLHVLCMFGH